jgi:putative nucleotidyltransferase with HDIG domain
LKGMNTVNLNRKTYAYIYTITALSVPVIYIVAVMRSEWSSFSLPTLIFWSILAAVTESLGITLPSGIGISVSLAINLASVVIGGPLMSVIVSSSGFLFRIYRTQGEKGFTHLFNTPVHKTIFNVSQSIIASGVSGFVFIWLGGSPGRFLLGPTLAIIPAYLFLNSIMISKLMALLHRERFVGIWFSNIVGILPSTIAIGVVGIIIALAYMSYGAGAVTLFLGPLLLARYSFKQYVDLRETYMETIQAFNRFMEAKDPYTGGHASRVESYAVELARHIRLPEQKIQNIRVAAILHDVGKIGIDDRILKKPSSLEDWEYEQIKDHPVIGSEIIKNVNFLKDTAEIIRHHHERYDGKGYPDQLKGDRIPVESSVLALADVYDAMTSDRPYREALSCEKAMDEIKNNSGKQFNPELTIAFLEILHQKKKAEKQAPFSISQADAQISNNMNRHVL